MAINLAGMPGVKTSVTPLGQIVANQVKGIICVQGETKRGKAGKQYLIASWNDYLDRFGGLRDDSDFPLMVKQALQSGSKLRITRACHYANPDDILSIDGTVATGSLANASVSAVGASVGLTIATWTGTGSNLKIVVPNLNGTGTIEIADYNGTNAQSAADAAVAVVSAINTGTGTHSYVATNPSGAIIVVSKPTTLGASGNGDLATFTIADGTISNATTKFAGGVTGYSSLTSTWDAEEVGDGYNGSIITLVPSANNQDGYVDITISLTDAATEQTISGVKRLLTDAQLASLNAQMLGVVVSGLATTTVGSVNYNTLPVGTVTLATGDQDITAITDDDYTGSSVSKTGWYAFDDVTDSMRIFNIARPTHPAALGLSIYLSGRQGSMRGRTYVPKGLTIQGINDFRDGSGAYVHQPLDNWLLDLWFAEMNITDPNNVNNPNYAINGGGFQCGNRSVADTNAGEWYSDSGNDYGKIVGVNGQRLNLGSPGNAGQYDVLYEKGVNAIITHPSFGVVNWGNRTTLRDKTSLLSKTNIADLVVYIANNVKLIAQKMNFKPNDLVMFQQLYLAVLPFIKDTLVTGRAIEGDTSASRGENKWWYWLGDQDAKSLEDLKINKASEVDAGKYRVRFAFKPIAANEYIGIDIAPADTATILNVAQITNLNN